MKLQTISRISIFFLFILLLAACGSSSDNGAVKTLAALDVYSTLTAEAKTDGAVDPVEPDAPADTDVSAPPTDQPAAPTNTAYVPAAPTDTVDALAYLSALMESEIQDLYSEGYLNSTAGYYTWLPDYSEAFAQINWIKPQLYNMEITEFVMRGNVAWETAAEGANIKNSGCGFYFGYHDDPAKYHVLLFSLDGNVKLFRMWSKDYIEAIGTSYYGSIDYLEGEVELTLIVEDNKIQGFVNGRQIFSRADQKVREGFVGYGFSSGTNAGFGTRCTFSNVDIWVLTP